MRFGGSVLIKMKSLGVRKFQSLLFVSCIETVLSMISLLADTVIAGHIDAVPEEAALSAMNNYSDSFNNGFYFYHAVIRCTNFL